jgi:ribose transport system permease protein
MTFDIRRFLATHQKTLAVFVLVVIITGVTGIFEESFVQASNLSRMSKWIGLYGIIAVGVAFVIITGGIDLSIGSLIALTSVMFPMLLFDGGQSPAVAFLIVLGTSAAIGVIHGLLITKLRLQPFVVTLCGLFIYRGIARTITGDRSVGFGNDYAGLKEMLVKGSLLNGTLPMPFVILIIISIISAILLNKTTFGRYILALGRNEQAAKFSGVNTDRMKIIAYVICSLLAGLAGIMFVMQTNTATPSNFGSFYELYAIAGAVLGGCSLRGGEGAIIGVICGTALMQVASEAVFFLGVGDTLKFAVIGGFILAGVIADEMLTRYTAKRRAMKAAL